MNARQRDENNQFIYMYLLTNFLTYVLYPFKKLYR